jgi:hypothetical protein
VACFIDPPDIDGDHDEHGMYMAIHPDAGVVGLIGCVAIFMACAA